MKVFSGLCFFVYYSSNLAENIPQVSSVACGVLLFCKVNEPNTYVAVLIFVQVRY